MRWLTGSVTCFLAVGLCAFGQHVGVINTGPRMPAPAGAYQFGNILWPGGIPPHTQMHASRVGQTIQGFPPYTGVQPIRGDFGHRVIVPYAVPVFVGGFWGGYTGQPAVTVVVPPVQQAPPVIINNYLLPPQASSAAVESERPQDRGETENRSGVQVYESKRPAPTRAEAPDPTPTYLIALKNRSVYSATAFWVEDGILYYATPHGPVNRVSLDMVDQDLTRYLNRDRKIDFTPRR